MVEHHPPILRGRWAVEHSGLAPTAVPIVESGTSATARTALCVKQPGYLVHTLLTFVSSPKSAEDPSSPPLLSKELALLELVELPFLLFFLAT